MAFVSTKGFVYPYEVRADEPQEFGIFVSKNGANFGPTTEQRIKAGFLKQLVRQPIRAIDLGDGIVIDGVDPDGTLHIHAVGGGGGGGSVMVEGSETTLPSQNYHFVSKHSDNGHQIATGAGALTGVNASGAGNSSTQFPVYIKLYDSNGRPDLSTAVPICVVLVQMGLQSPDPLPFGGVEFNDGLYVLAVNGIGDDDDTSVANGDCSADIFFRPTAGISQNSKFHLVAKGSTNHHLLKSGAGILLSVNASGAGNSSTQFPIYAKYYDKDTTPDTSVDVPIWVASIQMGIPTVNNIPDGGIPFDLGLHMFIVNGIQDIDATPVANGDGSVDTVWE